MKTYTEKQVEKLKGIYTADELAQLFNVIRFDDPEGFGRGETLSEANWEYTEERAIGAYAYQRGLTHNGGWSLTSADGETEIDVTKIRETSKLYEKLYGEIETELYKGWLKAIETTTDRILESIDLTTEKVKIKRVYENYVWEEDAYEIVPCKNSNWRNIAIQAMQSGSNWYISNLTEFRKEHGSTDRSSVINAFYNCEWQEWYGGQSNVNRTFENLLEHYLYSW